MRDKALAFVAAAAVLLSLYAVASVTPADAQTGNRVLLGINKEKWWWDAASCNNATPSTGWSLPTSNAAVPACATGSNTQRGTLDFADGANSLSAQVQILLPSDWNGTNAPAGVDAAVYWHSSTTTGNVVWQLQTSCATADADTADQAFNAANTVTDATQGTTNLVNLAAFGQITMTNCQASDMLYIKVFRDPANGSDTMAGTARMIGLTLTYRRLIASS